MNTLSHLLVKIKTTYFSLSLQKVLLVWVSLFLSILLLLIGLVIINDKLVVVIPKRGGTLTEGILGTPRFINPVLASSDEDETLATLIFAGLTKINKDNIPVNDMAETIEKSDDALTYTVTLKDNLLFHDGTKLSADDVIFTISLIQNPALKSPLKIKWEGVRVEKISDRKILFTLKQPYPLFTRALAIGILPKQTWKNLSVEEIAFSDQNIHAIGSGPYSLKSVDLVSGIPRIFTLKENKNYSLGRPYISTIIVHSYKNEKALEDAYITKEISSFATASPLSKELMAVPATKNSLTLPQTFSIFLNPNKNPFLADKDIRKALDVALHKETLIKTTFGDSAVVATTQYPFETTTYEVKSDDPKMLINQSAYKKKNATTTMNITLTIGDSEDNRKLAQAIKEKWSAVGVTTTIEIFEFSDLNQKVIKNRDFQAILSGTLIEDVSDLYAFWHSSQRAFPGLNIANYASSKMDQNLEELRLEENPERRATLAKNVEDELTNETPAIFLYHPKLMYITRSPLFMNFPEFGVSESSRFSEVEKWYKQTEKVWKYTYKQKVINNLEKIIH